MRVLAWTSPCFTSRKFIEILPGWWSYCIWCSLCRAGWPWVSSELINLAKTMQYDYNFSFLRCPSLTSLFSFFPSSFTLHFLIKSFHVWAQPSFELGLYCPWLPTWRDYREACTCYYSYFPVCLNQLIYCSNPSFSPFSTLSQYTLTYFMLDYQVGIEFPVLHYVIGVWCESVQL